jgi:subtilase family serine protease
MAQGAFAQASGRPPVGYARPPFHVHSNATQGPSGLSPAQIRHFYGLDRLSSSEQGGGQIIAIVDAYDNPDAESNLKVFDSTFGLPPCTTSNGCFSKVYSGTSARLIRADSGWALESSLDIEWAHAIAPQAKIVLVEAVSNSFADLMAAVAIAIAPQPRGVGASVVSMSWGGTEFLSETQYDGQFSSANGVSFVAASGDAGATVEYPAASPYVLAVGGTSIGTDASGDYLGEQAWSGSGGGRSAYEAEPSYQSNYPIPNDAVGARGIPDVAFGADPATGFAVYDAYTYQGQRGWFVVGGTSAGAPQWSGMLAIANGVRVANGKTTLNAVGSVNRVLYNVAATAYSANFHDIAAGTNGTCGVLCTAVPGYDYVTGLGSPVADSLVAALINAP